MIVGVAGKYCAGKNAVSRVLEEHGYRVIEVDKLGHRALVERQDAVVERFGGEILVDGKIDRRALGAKVFNDDDARADLEAIVHPVMVEWVRDFVRNLGSDPGVINAAILFQMELDAECDRVLWVTAPLLTRLRRARDRDGLGFLSLAKRFWAQRRLRPQQSSRRVEIYRVENRGSCEALEKQLRSLGLISK
ncbi:MAG: dephospho-CoA kinase [Spirochaetes bacterium]|nr:dephospho-CoA kinase [Spirochaetota bacterium]